MIHLIEGVKTVYASFIFLLATCFLFLPACDFGLSQGERDFKRNLQRMNQLMRAYEKIPDKQKVDGHTVIVWKDQQELSDFYEKNRAEFQAIDTLFMSISPSRNGNEWLDDALFGRAILYSLWTRVGPDRQIAEKAIAVLSEFVNLTPEPRLEELTKTAVQESFWNKYKEIITPELSYEENVLVLFQGSIGYLLMKLKEYEKARKQYEAIVKEYPTSKFSRQANDQLKTIQELSEGKIAIPKVPAQ